MNKIKLIIINLAIICLVLLGLILTNVLVSEDIQEENICEAYSKLDRVEMLFINGSKFVDFGDKYIRLDAIKEVCLE